MPATNSRFLPPRSGSHLAARWRQRFFFDPIYLGNPWEFSRNLFTVWYLSPSSNNFPLLLYQFYFRFGGRAPEKIFLTPNYTQSGSTISLTFGSLIRPRVPLRYPKFGENLTTGFSARWRQSFSLTPNISLTFGSFAKKISPPYTPPLALQIPPTSAPNSTSGLGVGPLEKNFWPHIKKFWEIYLRQNFAQWSALGCSCDPPNLVKIWQQNFEKLRKNRIFGLCFFSDFVTQSQIWRQPPKSFTELSGPFYTDNK